MIDPAAQQAPVAADPTAAPAPDQAAQGGFCVELYVKADGSMSVSVEPGKAEAAEDAGDPEGGEASQPVGNIGEALKLIREIVTHGGQPTDMAASQDEMSAGYGKAGM